jgi:phage-related protein
MVNKIIFYKSESNKTPIEDFLNSLSSQDRKKVAWTLRLISDLNIKMIPSKYLKKLINSDDIWEIRIKGKEKIFRVFSFFFYENSLVLTHGYTKKTDKTSKREIKKAEKCKKDFLKRKGERNE